MEATEITAPIAKQRTRRRWAWWKIALLILLLAALCGEIAISTILYCIQDVLVLPPHRLSPAGAQAIQRQHPGLRMVRFRAADGAALQGWRMPGRGAGRQSLLFYFGGQGGEVAGCVADVAQRTGWTVIGINYRGVGLSQGVPSETALSADTLAWYDHCATHGLHPRAVVAMGCSLGSGEAVYLAGHRPVRGVILSVPYDSIASVGQERFPFVPVSLILKHRFNSAAAAPAIHVPLLALLARNDTCIPPRHGLRLAEQWGGPVTVKLFPGVGHGNIGSNPEYWPAIRSLLKSM